MKKSLLNLISLFLVFNASVFFLEAKQLFTPPDSVAEQPLVAYQKDGLWHILDHTGKEILNPLPLAYLFGYSEGLFAAKAVNPNTKELTSIFFNTKGEVVIASEADVIDPFNNGMAITAMNTDNEELPYRAGFIDKQGKQIIPMEYVDFTNFEDGLAYLMDSLAKDGWRGYVDKNGNRVLNLPENVVGYKFNEGIAAVADSVPNVGYINTKGEYVLPPIYDSPGMHSEGLIATSDNGFLGYVSIEKQDFVIAPEFDVANPFKEGRAWVGKLSRDGKLKYGLIDKQGAMLRNFMFDYATEFSEGYAMVSLNNKFMYVDRDGEFPIGELFSFCSDFKNGIAWAAKQEEGKVGYIDKNGNFLIELPVADKYIDLRLNREVGLEAITPNIEMVDEE